MTLLRVGVSGRRIRFGIRPRWDWERWEWEGIRFPRRLASGGICSVIVCIMPVLVAVAADSQVKAADSQVKAADSQVKNVAPGLSVAELRAAYVEQVRSIRTISATYSIIDSATGPTAREQVDPDSTAKTTKSVRREPGRQRWRYLRDDAKFYLAELTGDNMTPVPASIWDGTNLFSVGQPAPSQQHLGSFVQVFDGLDPAIKQNYRPEHLIGAELLLADLSLAEALELPAIRLMEPAQDAAISAWTVVVDAIPSHQGFDMRLVVEFDRAYDFLPRRIELTEAVPAGGVARFGGWRMEWRIDEFKEVLDNASGKMKWFPCVARLIQQAGANSPTFRIDDIAINTDIPEMTFNPQVPPGTQVMDNTKSGAGRVYMVGDDDPLDRRVSEIARTARKESPRLSYWGWFLIVNIGLFLVIVTAITTKKYLLRH